MSRYSKQNTLFFLKKRILVTLSGGGFFYEASLLQKGLREYFECQYVTTTQNNALIQADKLNIPHEKIHVIRMITTMSEKQIIKKIKNTFFSFLDTYKIIKMVDPFAVICIGTSISVPLCLCAKLLGKKAIFVESITRVTKPSLTGKIISTFRLCDRLYVQWPEAVNLYKGAIYRGRV